MKFGGYDVLSELGRGGSGAVFRARSPRGDEVALKLLLRIDGDRLARFERERRLLGLFTARDGFVPLLDAGTIDGAPYLVMPLLAGGTLRKRLARGRFGFEETIALGRSLAEALGRAHQGGVVHRDMKPENVLFTAEGAPLVADLGLAKHFDREAPCTSRTVSLSRPGAARGTPGYMAPEQLADARAVEPAADVFALGAILYECLAGERAFRGEEIEEILENVRTGTFAPLRGARPDVPVWLAAVIEQALAKEPSRRFRDAVELRRALDGPERVPTALVAGGALLLVALGAGVVTYLVSREGAPRGARTAAPAPPAPAPPAPARTLEPDDAQELVDNGTELYQSGDLAGALRDFDHAIALDPRCATAFLDRGSLRNDQGDHPGAIADYTHAIELDPSLALAFYGRGHVRQADGDLEGAISDYTRATELNPGDVQAFINRGNTWQGKGDLDRAISDYDRALTIDPRHPKAYFNRGSTRRMKGDLAGALSDLDRALEIDPSYVLALKMRAAVRQQKGDLAGAAADLQRQLELDPNDPQAADKRRFIEVNKAKGR